MITENQLNEAIAEMQGQRHPDANTCLKLASYYTIKDKLFPEEQAQIDRYSYSAPVAESMIGYSSKTEFGEAVYGKPVNDVMGAIDEIMTGLYAVNPHLYRRIMEELTE